MDSSAYIATPADATAPYRFPVRVADSVHPAAAAVWRIPPRIWLTAYYPELEPDSGSYHMLALDGVYTEDNAGFLRFHTVGSPSDKEVERVAAHISRRVEKLIMRQGLMSGASVIPARDRMRLERMARYMCRPPIAIERLKLLSDGRLIYRQKKQWRDGTSHIIFQPLELMERLAALIPAPRFNMIRYSEVLAPSAAWRRRIIPQEAVSETITARSEEKTETEKGSLPRPRRYAWAELLKMGSCRCFEMSPLR